MLKNLRQVVTILETILKVNVYFSFLSKWESRYKSTFFYYYQTETQNRSILNSQDQSFGSKNDDSAEDNAMYLQFSGYSNVMRSCNIKQMRVDHSDIKQKNGMEYLFCYVPSTANKIWEDKG